MKTAPRKAAVQKISCMQEVQLNKMRCNKLYILISVNSVGTFCLKLWERTLSRIIFSGLSLSYVVCAYLFISSFKIKISGTKNEENDWYLLLWTCMGCFSLFCLKRPHFKKDFPSIGMSNLRKNVEILLRPCISAHPSKRAKNGPRASRAMTGFV